MRATGCTLSVALIALITFSCQSKTDFVKVALHGDPSLSTSSLSLHVDVRGAGATTSFDYESAPKPGRKEPTLSEFTLSFGPHATGPLDIVVSTSLPSGSLVPWGGDARLTLPGNGKTVTIGLEAGESALQDITTLDGDIQSSAPYGGELVVAWPTARGTVSIAPINPDRPQQGIERPPEFGASATKIRVASRPSSDFTSELYAASWVEQRDRPMLKTSVRTQAFAPQRIGTLEGVTDVHTACARRELTPPIATAALTSAGVVVHTHDETGITLRGPLTTRELTAVNRIVGLAVTPNETVTVAVNGNGARLVQIDTKTGKTVHTEPLLGTAVAMSPNADGSRLLVASVVGLGADATLQLETFSITLVRVGESTTVAPFDWVPGVPASRVSLSSCAMAWASKSPTNDASTDVRFQELDILGQPAGTPHLANVGRESSHFSPTLVCLSQTRLSQTRAFITFFEAGSPTGPNGKLMLRQLPTMDSTP